MSVRSKRGATTTEQASANVRFYRPGDEEGMLRVLQASFPRWPEVETSVAPIDHLRWKLAGAEPPERNHIVAEANGQIIGCRISLLRPVRCIGDTRVARTDTDNAVAPEWRGRGVNTAIIRLAVDSSPADIVFTTTDTQTLLRSDRALGHLPVRNRLSTMICDLPAQYISSPGFASIREIASVDERIELFWRNAALPFDLIAAPSADRLNWHYCDPRGGNGFVLQAEGRGDIIGFLAGRISRGQGYVAYLLALAQRPDVVRELLAAGLSRFHASGVREVSCALPERHPYRPLLFEGGFLRAGHRIPLTARPRIGEPPLPFLRKQSSIHWMFGDTDLV